MTAPNLLITASPHLSARDSTPKIMWHVVLSLVPVLGAACYFFGVSALLVTSGAVLGAVVTEAVFGQRGTLWDGSAAITGVLLALTLPPGLPMWMAFIGGAFAIGQGAGPQDERVDMGDGPDFSNDEAVRGMQRRGALSRRCDRAPNVAAELFVGREDLGRR